MFDRQNSLTSDQAELDLLLQFLPVIMETLSMIQQNRTLFPKENNFQCIVTENALNLQSILKYFVTSACSIDFVQKHFAVLLVKLQPKFVLLVPA